MNWIKNLISRIRLEIRYRKKLKEDRKKLKEDRKKLKELRSLDPYIYF